MSHDDACELLASLALDALDEDMRVTVEAHVETCAECQNELDELREVASALGTSVETPPSGLWDHIASQLYVQEGDRSDEAPVLASGMFVPPAGVLANRRSRRVRGVLSTVLLAAAAAIVALSLNLANESGRVSNLQSALASGAAQQALVTPGHHVVRLTGGNDRVLATFVVLRDGTGYLLHSNMPSLSEGKTYQLWGIVNNKAVSVGIMGSHPREVAFTLASSQPTQLAVTVEPAGGSPTPTTAVVATGEL
ncbi:MAG TPA: anti-sigma factor [Acidimicrobiales bacterium]|jgi:anti-sigma-K factor RskA